MIPEKIQALFDFIDYLDERKTELINKYLPLCSELSKLNIERSKLNPRSNYIDKQKYDEIQKIIEEKFQPITQDIYTPVITRLKELKIWSGDDVFASIWNNNYSSIQEFKEKFESEDLPEVFKYKQKYLLFRKETNSNFLCLQFVFDNLDEINKELFDFFKDTCENEFESFETKTVEVKSMSEILKGFISNEEKNVKYSIPHESLFDYQNVKQYLPQQPTIKNEIFMGHKIQVGDITNNSGQIIIGKDIKISDSLNGKSEIADKISELIELIWKEQNIGLNQKQTLITNFDKVKEELFEEQPSKSKIHKWLTNIKEGLEKLVLSHEVIQAIDWLYRNFNFILS
ncbi:hypothetical protein [Lacihabitans sp. CS3-21]|uniref:hypothetical protein n=1 Tax=Lacihabitans sp. CS3-21 TaxID=2487332 RepID=UPI0020CC397B|nr:hypothetical protein [Lacihabitans sp. CS3-21]MCP9749329.1 hypothetical protein [Lacihabitans sp. CS3-21]